MSPITQTEVESPITGPELQWRAIIWILTTLAVNSMVQPSGKVCAWSSRFRVHLKSSPIVCLADAISTAVRLITTITCLKLSFKQASHLVVLTKFGKVEISVTDEKNQPSTSRRPPIPSWPRWVFFALGTFPAIFKLGSVSGAPWTKAWGIMFISSATLTDMINFTSQGVDLDQDIVFDAFLGTDASGVDATQQDLYAKAVRVSRRLKLVDSVLPALALIAHCGVLTWAINALWMPSLPYLQMPENMRNGFLWFSLIIYASIPLAGISLLGLWYMEREVHPRYRLACKWLIWLMVLCALSPSQYRKKRAACECPPETEGMVPPPPDWLTTLANQLRIWLYLMIGNRWAKNAITRVCRRWPLVVDVLMIGHAEDADVESPDVKAGPICPDAWLSLCFLVLSVTTGILWYAFLYDSRGTINPPWTATFG